MVVSNLLRIPSGDNLLFVAIAKKAPKSAPEVVAEGQVASSSGSLRHMEAKGGS